jgi:hypothetical protein
MNPSEQSDDRLVLVSKGTFLTYICGLAAFVLGLVLIFGTSRDIVYTFVVGPIGVLAGASMLLSPIRCILTIDKNMQRLSIKKAYLFGLIPITQRLGLTDLIEFVVQHRLAARLRPARLKLIFKAQHRNLTFSSGTLHFADGSGLLDPGAYDPRNSSEEALIPIIANYIGIPATPKERAIDTTNLSRRLFYFTLIFFGGFIVAIAATWIYFHLIRIG